MRSRQSRAVSGRVGQCSLLVCGVTFLYVTYGGMRSTAWANTFQTTVFILVGIVAYLVIMDHYGGIGKAMATLRETHPRICGFWQRLLYRIQNALLSHATHQCRGISPYLRPLALRPNRAIISNAYRILPVPLCIAAVWVPSVTLGMVGARIDFTAPLNGPILIELILGPLRAAYWRDV